VRQRDAAQTGTRDCSARPSDAAFQQPTARGGRAPLTPTPAAYPSPAGLATLGSASPPGPGPPDPSPRHRPGPAGALAVTGPLMARRQRPRRRITPNANTSTTTMISTHNHVDMAASLVGAGAVQADATAGHPSKQLGHRQASSRSRIDGRAARRLAGPRHPATGPPIWAGQVGASPTPSRSSHEYRHPVPRNPALLSSPAWP
jgi:hypothetical protein